MGIKPKLNNMELTLTPNQHGVKTLGHDVHSLPKHAPISWTTLNRHGYMLLITVNGHWLLT